MASFLFGDVYLVLKVYSNYHNCNAHAFVNVMSASHSQRSLSNMILPIQDPRERVRHALADSAHSDSPSVTTRPKL